ncbi:Polycomb protein, VEFS-Box [Dillenia turbinata]|uniref:Polycomb protein, VEFS-Box n=1 Tax=Dillenia turbinata TaxID=194707 RepID=A0AAN8VW58_9MAGN
MEQLVEAQEREEVPGKGLITFSLLKRVLIFAYRIQYGRRCCYLNKLTEDFTCPFCLVKCASFKGLRSHLPSSHDLFNFEFWVGKLEVARLCSALYTLLVLRSSAVFVLQVTEEYQAVNVSVKSDITKSEVGILSVAQGKTFAVIVADGVDPKQQTFFFRSKPPRHRKSKKVAISKNVHPLVLDCDSAAAGGEGFSKVFLERADVCVSDALSSKAGKAHLHSENDLRMGCSSATGCMEHITSANITRICSVMAQSHADPDCAQSAEGNLAPPTMLQFAKTRKLSMERFDSRKCVCLPHIFSTAFHISLLQKRQFFHSHRAQPMALEQVLLDRDSEDEVDDDVADFEDRRCAGRWPHSMGLRGILKIACT